MDKMNKRSKIEVLIYNFFNSNYNASEYTLNYSQINLKIKLLSCRGQY